MRLEGKIALVTGAGSVGDGWGNGKATAVLFAREGATVLLSDISADALDVTRKLVEAEGARCETLVADVTASENCKGLVDRCVDQFGGIDVLYNNVGGSAPGGPVELSEQQWHDQIDHNLNHVFYMCKHALPMMEKTGGGAVVNVASIAGIRYIGHPHIAYSATKSAVIQFTRSLGVQYANRGIRANTIVPGLMHTPLVEVRLAGQRSDGDAKKLIEDRNAQVPMGRMGTAWDVAHAAAFLASDDARYITATELVVDGGLTARV